MGLIAALILGAGERGALAAEAVQEYSLQLTAQIQEDPPQIRVTWPAQTTAGSLSVQRKTVDSPVWGRATVLPGSVDGYTDTNVLVGAAYEYHVARIAPTYETHAYISAGIQIPLNESRGTVLLLVDDRVAPALPFELKRLEQDLVGDGWLVVRRDVPRMSVSPANESPEVSSARSNEVAAVKEIIRSEYLANPSGVRAVFLLGHVPVPYSGAAAPDQHPDHRGSWPADAYYGDVNGLWTDSAVSVAVAADPRNRNQPGDGKFDQSYTPAPVALEVGRVDMSDLWLYPVSELELLRHYLEKDHAFRHAEWKVEERALIDDRFGVLSREIPALSGWNGLAPLVGTSLYADRWLSVLPQQDFLWGYGAGEGTYTRAAGVVESSHLVVYDMKVVFAMMFGSYFGDWDTPNNLLRSILATPSLTLASVWSGRPSWFFHHMALGETIGFSARMSQRNSGLYSEFYRPRGTLEFPVEPFTNGVHMALLGDPTLRLHPVSPPSSLRANSSDSGGVELTWNPSTNNVLGYYVYRAASAGGPYSRVTSNLLTETVYTDPERLLGRFYMVRAIKLQSSPSGSYFNASQGIFAEASLPIDPTGTNTWYAGGMGTWRINDAAGEPGTTAGWDLTTVPGALTITATPSDPFILRLVSESEAGLAGPPAHFDRDRAYNWRLLTATTNIVGFDPAKVSLVTSDFLGDLGGGRFDLVEAPDEKSLDLTFTPNRAPETKPAVYTRAWDAVLRVKIQDLLKDYTTDPDGDLVSLAPQLSSTNGTLISSDGVFLSFTPSNNFAETITYWVQDVRNYRTGDTVRLTPGTITIEPLPTATQFSAFHAVELEWLAASGQRYQLQYRAGSSSEWLNEGEPIVGTGAKVSFFQRATDPLRIYRVISLK